MESKKFSDRLAALASEVGVTFLELTIVAALSSLLMVAGVSGFTKALEQSIAESTESIHIHEKLQYKKKAVSGGTEKENEGNKNGAGGESESRSRNGTVEFR